MRSVPSAACCERWPVADRWNDERLREITLIAARERARVEEIKRLRAEVERLRVITDDRARGMEAELLAARAEVERLRSRVGWLDHLDTVEGKAMHATEAVRIESDQLRADLREAMELLRELGRPDHGDDLDARYVAFLTKHKETP